MRYTPPRSRLFSTHDLRKLCQKRLTQMGGDIRSESDSYVLNTGEEAYIQHLVSKYAIDNLQIHFDKQYVEHFEADIPAEYFPSFQFDVREGKCYAKPVYRVRIPFEGESDLLFAQASTYSLAPPLASVERGEVYFDIIDFYDNDDDPEQLRRKIESTVSGIKKQSEYTIRDVEVFNNRLEAEARGAFRGRKAKLLKKHNKLAKLGIPLKTSDNNPSTYAISAPKRRPKIIVARPTVTDTPFEPEPTIEDTAYQDILRIIHEYGTSMEQKPSMYQGKSEEDIRDLFLARLQHVTDGTVTGETFNKSGKTDILLRHDGTNAFIAECKKWKGKKVLLDTIAQLLAYLTWRDSKAAVIFFVENQDITNVLSTAQSEVPNHTNYVKSVNAPEDSWFNYIFHLNDDPNREIKLAVLLFHFPK